MVGLVTYSTYHLLTWLPAHLHTQRMGKGREGHRGITIMHHITIPRFTCTKTVFISYI
ncbi:hypothetical protein E2C01_038605 [Portunus trituberculatus]|uniref:Uncharacterized protein n=1 Tax=Portunus trituberculatus TaxID=210409 RepID=A0A5B7FIF9_PORTR|nr:hypothetical protein [Portunus trituberculatus]